MPGYVVPPEKWPRANPLPPAPRGGTGESYGPPPPPPESRNPLVRMDGPPPPPSYLNINVPIGRRNSLAARVLWTSGLSFGIGLLLTLFVMSLFGVTF